MAAGEKAVSPVPAAVIGTDCVCGRLRPCDASGRQAVDNGVVGRAELVGGGEGDDAGRAEAGRRNCRFP